jgi:hypothetical protein
MGVFFPLDKQGESFAEAFRRRNPLAPGGGAQAAGAPAERDTRTPTQRSRDQYYSQGPQQRYNRTIAEHTPAGAPLPTGVTNADFDPVAGGASNVVQARRESSLGVDRASDMQNREQEDARIRGQVATDMANRRRSPGSRFESPHGGFHTEEGARRHFESIQAPEGGWNPGDHQALWQHIHSANRGNWTRNIGTYDRDESKRLAQSTLKAVTPFQAQTELDKLREQHSTASPEVLRGMLDAKRSDALRGVERTLGESFDNWRKGLTEGRGVGWQGSSAIVMGPDGVEHVKGPSKVVQEHALMTGQPPGRPEYQKARWIEEATGATDAILPKPAKPVAPPAAPPAVAGKPPVTPPAGTTATATSPAP